MTVHEDREEQQPKHWQTIHKIEHKRPNKVR